MNVRNYSLAVTNPGNLGIPPVTPPKQQPLKQPCMPPPIPSVSDTSSFTPAKHKSHSNRYGQVSQGPIRCTSPELDKKSVSRKPTQFHRARPTTVLDEASLFGCMDGPAGVANISKSSKRLPDLVFPIADTMGGDVGHVLGAALYSPDSKVHIIHTGAINHSSPLALEFKFYLGEDRVTETQSPHAHKTYNKLVKDSIGATRKKSSPQLPKYLKAGHATKMIAGAASEGQKSPEIIKAKLEPLLTEHGDTLLEFISETFRINLDTSVAKVFLWARKSGKTNGVHVESDSSGAFIKALYTAVTESSEWKETPFQCVLAGDKHKTPLDREALKDIPRDTVGDCREFWKTEEFKTLITQTGISSHLLQTLIFLKLDHDGHKLIFLGNRTGIIDKLAFSLSNKNCHFLELIPEHFNNGRLDCLQDHYLHLEETEIVPSPKGRLVDLCLRRFLEVEQKYELDYNPQERSKMMGTFLSNFNPEKIQSTLRTVDYRSDHAASEEKGDDLRASNERFNHELLHHFDALTSPVMKSITSAEFEPGSLSALSEGLFRPMSVSEHAKLQEVINAQIVLFLRKFTTPIDTI